MLTSATALQRHQLIHARLQLEILDVREEVARLKGELRRDQDPARMGHIQKQIAVSIEGEVWGLRKVQAGDGVLAIVFVVLN